MYLFHLDGFGHRRKVGAWRDAGGPSYMRERGRGQSDESRLPGLGYIHGANKVWPWIVVYMT